MIKLKRSKGIIKSAVPTRRIKTFEIPISDLKIPTYKFPHISFDQPSIKQAEETQLKKGKLILKYWTKRFFVLIAPQVSPLLLFKFNYQLKKYGLEVSYKLVWHLIRMAVSNQITPIKIKTRILRKRVREKKVLYKEFRLAIHDLKTDFEMRRPNAQSYLQALGHNHPIQSLAMSFPGSQIFEEVFFRTELPNFSAIELTQLQIEASDINAVMIPPLQTKRIIISSNLGLQSSLFEEHIQTLTPPKIKQVDINSPYMYALKKKSGQKRQSESNIARQLETEKQ